MKAIIQLAIVALLLNAGYQTARSYYDFCDFRSNLTEEIQRQRTTTTSQLRQRAMELAIEYGLELERDAIQIRVEGDRTFVDFSYVDQVPLVPKYYVRPWLHEGSISALRARPLIVDERLR
jgi:hypothetical protein